MSGGLIRPIRVYADTSVFGGVFDEEFRGPSTEFFRQVREGVFDLVLSPLLALELKEAPREVRDLFERIDSLCDRTGPIEEALALQEAYLSAGILSRKWEADALHVALATVSSCRIIVSWNFKHLVHFQKIPLYNAVNRLRGYGELGIHTPLEVIKYEDL